MMYIMNLLWTTVQTCRTSANNICEPLVNIGETLLAIRVFMIIIIKIMMNPAAAAPYW